jgi:hypothetical protein
MFSSTAVTTLYSLEHGGSFVLLYPADKAISVSLLARRQDNSFGSMPSGPLNMEYAFKRRPDLHLRLSKDVVGLFGLFVTSFFTPYFMSSPKLEYPALVNGSLLDFGTLPLSRKL